MGLIDFIKDAGERLFGKRETGAAESSTPVDSAKILTETVQRLGLKVQNLQINVAGDVATVLGTAASQEEREKVILVVGNTQGVAQVDDQLQVERPEPQAVLYTVARGDTLSKIAKGHYGNASQYMTIFNANKPMLKDPDKIYPGQVLRIPPRA